MKQPPGLRIYRGFLSSQEVDEILSEEEYHNNSKVNPQLFRLYGDFGNKASGDVAPWMRAWGEETVKRGIFSTPPTQYRVCDWIGDLRGQFKWHIDSKRQGKLIFSISLSETRVMGFREKDARDIFRLELGKGDAYLMKGASRWNWEHCVLPCSEGRSGGKSFIMNHL